MNPDEKSAILVVDDDPSVLESTSRLLSAFGYIVFPYGNATDAVSSRKTMFRIILYGFLVLVMGNLGAMVDLLFHPEIPYFDEEHLIVGGIAAIVMAIFCGVLETYLRQRDEVEVTLRELERRSAESTEYKQLMIDHSPLGIATYDAESGACVSANGAVAKIIGTTLEKAQGQNFRQLESWQTSGLLKTAEDVLSDGEERLQEVQFVTTFGKKIWIDCRFARFMIRDKPHLLLMIADITERKRAEAEVRSGRERLDFLLSASPSVIYTRKPSGDFAVTFISEGIASQLGYTPSDFLEDPGFLARNIHPEDAPRVFADLPHLFETGRHTHEYRFLSRDGTFRWVHDGMKLVRDADGTPREIVGSWTDITEMKRAVEAERESEEKFRLIFENASDGILLADAESLKLEMANRKMCEMLKYSEEEIRRLRILDIHPGKNLPNVLVEFQEAGDGVRTETDITMKRKDGTVFLADIASSTISIKGKQYLLGIFRDRTQERMLQQQLQATEKMKSLGTMAGGIAHDFNNLLMAVLGHAELALDKISPMSPVRESFTEIMTAARRAADLSLQMLAYAGKASIAPERVGLRELVEEMAHLLKRTISKKAILNLSLEGDLPPIKGDPSQIRQVVMNLVVNASEALGEGSGVITVSAGATRCDEEYLQKTELHEALFPGLYVHLEVTDTGTGMDADTRARIFDPFFSTKFTGRGLGLAAVLGIVRAHKGAIKVYSEPCKGTTFKVLFPALEDASKGPTAVDSSPLADWRGTGTILLVDDDESLLALGARMLDLLGFNVLTAADGLQAVELYREKGATIDLVLMDLTMPHMDGAEAFSELRRLNPDVRVVLASGYSQEDVASRFAGKRLDGVLQKPYTLSKLREALAGLTAKRPDGMG